MNANPPEPIFWKPFKDALDFERRYRFLDPAVTIAPYGQPEKVIVMAIKPGLEGNLGEERNEPGRWLIVELQSGKIQTRNYPEDLLGRLFEKAGSDLRNYSTSKGSWMELTAAPGKDTGLDNKRVSRWDRCGQSTQRAGDEISRQAFRTNESGTLGRGGRVGCRDGCSCGGLETAADLRRGGESRINADRHG